MTDSTINRNTSMTIGLITGMTFAYLVRYLVKTIRSRGTRNKPLPAL